MGQAPLKKQNALLSSSNLEGLRRISEHGARLLEVHLAAQALARRGISVHG